MCRRRQRPGRAKAARFDAMRHLNDGLSVYYEYGACNVQQSAKSAHIFQKINHSAGSSLSILELFASCAWHFPNHCSDANNINLW
jgi:hypothetical protein